MTKDENVDAALDALFSELPEEMGEQELLDVLVQITVTYTENSREAIKLLAMAAQKCGEFFAINGEVCMCTRCRSERMKRAN